MRRSALGAALAAVVITTGCTAGADSTARVSVPAPTPWRPFAASLRERMPDALTAASTGCSRRKRSAGWIARENRRRGTTVWRVSQPTDPAVTGYLSSFQVVCGGTVEVHASGDGLARVQVFRLGWYGGPGGRLVTQTTSRPLHRAAVVPAARHRTASARWPIVFRLHVDTDWVPGLYLVELVTPTGLRFPMPLVVNDPVDRTPLLVVASTMTWTAYNGFGGASLYRGKRDSSANRAYAASMDRPLIGNGYTQFWVDDLPMASLIEQTGLDVSYTTDVMLDRRPQVALMHRCLVFGSHSEYWTRRMFDGVEAARDAGVNVAFLGGNDIYWQARLDGDVADPRTVLVYRQAKLDPARRTDPDLLTTRWTDRGRDSAELTGATFSTLGFAGAGYLMLQTPAWLVRGTTLRRGSVLAGVGRNEADAVDAAVRATPGDIEVLAVALVDIHGRVGDGPWSLVTASYYTAPSGAAVFDAGTTRWVCATDNNCPEGPTDSAVMTNIRTMTQNVLRAFAHAGWGRTHPSRRSVTPAVSDLLREIPSQAIGHATHVSRDSD